MNELIAVVDDEPDILALISLHLKKAGFQVAEFREAREFFAFLGKKRPALVVLDLMLPDADGLEVCKSLRRNEEWATIPVIMVTAKTEETDRILGLEVGADDYVTKPFSARELVARVKAVLRRLKAPMPAGRYEIGDLLRIDPEKYQVWVEGREVDLTSTEFKILHLLASGRGRVFTRDKLLDSLWGPEKIVLDRTIDVHIRNLRAKLGRAARLVKNIRGVGYRLEA